MGNVTIGHINAGEASYFAAKRELQEELGINLNDQTCIAKIIFLFSYKSYISNQYNDVYVAFSNIDENQIKFDKNEIEEIKLIHLDQFEIM